MTWRTSICFGPERGQSSARMSADIKTSLKNRARARSRSARRRCPFGPVLPALRARESEWQSVGVQHVRPAVDRRFATSARTDETPRHVRARPRQAILWRSASPAYQQGGLEIGPAITGKGHTVTEPERIAHDRDFVDAGRGTEERESWAAPSADRPPGRIFPDSREAQRNARLPQQVLDIPVASRGGDDELPATFSQGLNGVGETRLEFHGSDQVEQGRLGGSNAGGRSRPGLQSG